MTKLSKEEPRITRFEMGDFENRTTPSPLQNIEEDIVLSSSLGINPFLKRKKEKSVNREGFR